MNCECLLPNSLFNNTRSFTGRCTVEDRAVTSRLFCRLENIQHFDK